MKQILFLLLMLSTTVALAQKGGWALLQNDKAIFTARTEDEEKNKLALQRAHFAQGQKYVLTYKGSTAKGWKRYIVCTTPDGTDLREVAAAALAFTAADLKTWTQQHKDLQFYTWTIPADPAKAAVVRVRRVHLVTLTAPAP